MYDELTGVSVSVATPTTNACKLCSPLGASMVFKGIEGSLPLLHGSQGCATYIRRYLISHFKEPVDIASSSFTEETAVFGGGYNLRRALENVTKQYNPLLIGVATTCLSETIGDDVALYINQYLREKAGLKRPLIINVSTPSYKGTHMDGFHAAVKAVVDSLAEDGSGVNMVNLLPGFVSSADLRYLKEVITDYTRLGAGTDFCILPDYSETMDGPLWTEYQKIPPGGTKLEQIKKTGRARATLEFGRTITAMETAGKRLQERFRVPLISCGIPIGVRETDRFFALLTELTGVPVPEKYRAERGRLIDSFVDAHKYVFGKRAVIYGEEDLVVGITSLLAEVGIEPVLCASGGESGRFAQAIKSVVPEKGGQPEVREGVDFMTIAEEVERLKPDLLIGNSKGYSLARKLNIPLVRIGFPIHDRIGGPRLLHLGYRGAQQLFDTVVNTIIDRKQSASPVGYTYM